MKPFRRLEIILLITVALLLLASALIVTRAPGIAHCYLVRWSALDNIAPNVYVDPDMPESQGQTLLSSLADAKERVAALYGDSAGAVIIAGHTLELVIVFAGEEPGDDAVEHIIQAVQL